MSDDSGGSRMDRPDIEGALARWDEEWGAIHALEVFPAIARWALEVEEYLKDAEHSAKVYRDALHKVAVEFDIRCVDKPSQVGCSDLEFNYAEIAKEKYHTLQTAVEAVEGEIPGMIDKLQQFVDERDTTIRDDLVQSVLYWLKNLRSDGMAAARKGEWAEPKWVPVTRVHAKPDNCPNWMGACRCPTPDAGEEG